MRRAIAVCTLLALALPATAEDTPAPWSEAAAHVGEIVTVEGFVREVRDEGLRLTLVFDPADPGALRVTLLIALLTDLPPDPAALYRERRVRVRGRVTRTAGHLDLVVTDPDRIDVVGLTAAPGAAEEPAVPNALDAAAGHAGEAPAAAPEPTTGPSPSRSPRPTPPSPDTEREAPSDPACARLRAARDMARRAALDAVAELRRCLEAGTSGCREAADAIAGPVARLEWVEQDLRDRCP